MDCRQVWMGDCTIWFVGNEMKEEGRFVEEGEENIIGRDGRWQKIELERFRTNLENVNWLEGMV